MSHEVQAVRRDHDALAKEVAVQGTQQVKDDTEVCQLDLCLVHFIFEFVGSCSTCRYTRTAQTDAGCCGKC